VYSSGGPYGGPMVTGFDIYTSQCAAARFTPSRDCSLTSLSVWVMTNARPGSEVTPSMTVTLREDVTGQNGESLPAGAVLSTWLCTSSSTPFSPQVRLMACEDTITLVAGRQYWVVAQSGAELRSNVIWNWSGQEGGYIALTDSEGQWSGGPGVALTLEVRGETCGTADFNGDGDTGTDQDIEAFFACLAGSCCPTCGNADFNGDGDFGTDQDIETFFRVLAGQPC
jgi:hypothetical protein